ncbi:MAG: hypothetical protein M1826_006833 [Phylliscum demangeonii]|nr:MAG: hypothetical protein M1826_006833 [Phylliscum demangeonii]
MPTPDNIYHFSLGSVLQRVDIKLLAHKADPRPRFLDGVDQEKSSAADEDASLLDWNHPLNDSYAAFSRSHELLGMMKGGPKWCLNLPWPMTPASWQDPKTWYGLASMCQVRRDELEAAPALVHCDDDPDPLHDELDYEDLAHREYLKWYDRLWRFRPARRCCRTLPWPAHQERERSGAEWDRLALRAQATYEEVMRAQRPSAREDYLLQSLHVRSGSAKPGTVGHVKGQIRRGAGRTREGYYNVAVKEPEVDQMTEDEEEEEERRRDWLRATIETLVWENGQWSKKFLFVQGVLPDAVPLVHRSTSVPPPTRPRERRRLAPDPGLVRHRVGPGVALRRRRHSTSSWEPLTARAPTENWRFSDTDVIHNLVPKSCTSHDGSGHTDGPYSSTLLSSLSPSRQSPLPLPLSMDVSEYSELNSEAHPTDPNSSSAMPRRKRRRSNSLDAEIRDATSPTTTAMESKTKRTKR